MLGPLRVPNRVLLAPLAGIGNWFVRLQAKRYGAGMAVSEMVSSHAIHYGNEKTCVEMLRIDPRERAGGPVSIQLFGEDPAMMRSAAAHVARRGRRRDRHQHGLPGAEGAQDGRRARRCSATPTARSRWRARPSQGRRRAGRCRSRSSCARACARARRAASSSRTGWSRRRAWRRSPFTRARRPCSTRACPTTSWRRGWSQSLRAPVILTGGLSDAARVREAFAQTGAAAVMLARGALGNPWLFARAARGRREQAPTREEVAGRARLDDRRAPSSTSASRARRATCASSIPGTWRAWGSTRASAKRPAGVAAAVARRSSEVRRPAASRALAGLALAV